MKTFRTIAIFTAMTMFVTVFSGCTREEQQFISAIDMMSNAKTYEQSSHVSFELDFSGGGEYYLDSMTSSKNIVDNLKLNMFQKFEGDAANNKFKAFVNYETVLDPVTVSADMWVDLDMNAADPKYQIIVRIPPVIKGFLPEELSKEYLNIDYFEYLDFIAEQAGISDVGFVKTIMNSANMKTHAMSGLAAMEQSDQLGGDLVKSSKTDDGLTKLTLTLTDAQLKSFVTTFLNTNAVLKQELTKQGMEMARVEEYFRDNEILGAKGLVYAIVLDENGYIANQDIVVDICLDDANTIFNPSGIYGYYDDDENYTPGRLELTTTIQSENTSINEEISINYPQINDYNSIDFVSVMRKQAEERKEWEKYYFPAIYFYDSLMDIGETPVQFPLKGVYKDKEINSAIDIYTPHENFYGFCIPIDQAATLFGGEVTKGGEPDKTTWTVDSKTINLTVQPTDIDPYEYHMNNFDDNGQSVIYGEIGYTFEDEMFISIDILEAILGVDFGYDEETKTILLK